MKAMLIAATQNSRMQTPPVLNIAFAVAAFPFHR